MIYFLLYPTGGGNNIVMTYGDENRDAQAQRFPMIAMECMAV
jgi:hypothetical protein